MTRKTIRTPILASGLFRLHPKLFRSTICLAWFEMHMMLLFSYACALRYASISTFRFDEITCASHPSPLPWASTSFYGACWNLHTRPTCVNHNVSSAQHMDSAVATLSRTVLLWANQDSAQWKEIIIHLGDNSCCEHSALRLTAKCTEWRFFCMLLSAANPLS